MTNSTSAPKFLVSLVRLQGFILSAAAIPVLMPTAWMDLLHSQLHIGPFPLAPIVEYLTRSISALYAVHGVLLVFISFDLERYRPLLGMLILLHGVLGLAMLGIDLWAVMPWWWTLSEGPPIIAFAMLLGVFYWRWPVALDSHTSSPKNSQ
jgi:hypothetical protein